ncbi:phosphoribose diphosphate:decaprenyl-phosphate phosphoribosyltransferase [Thiorhodovibrio winogradskyi]|uniref:Phosphoribose diphosphate:decaprenyl-phosphate phosphoribosyltransferase n=1 Tax=Thiorhodovibrio winogradskyi TaxID=77007 RepID=A0ABZ0S9I3_9GAMM|nr:UbiA family prenyltransferase [Thiorhodovibrio winogradskyi]
MDIKPYFQIARFDHWFKNVFVLPGMVVAIYAQPELISVAAIWHLILALVAVGFVASSNYVINEVLDAPKDALHPVKKNRPVPSGQINVRIAYGEWLLLAVIGLLLSVPLGLEFFLTNLSLWIMGCFYNIPPIRTKDQPYLDVLSESVNNPLRLLMGWYSTGIAVIPPVSLVAAYWMVGAFFMAVKRFAEYRRINDPETARQYRSSFSHYNQERLLVSITYYGCAFGLFFGIFLVRYRIELILSIPLIAGFIAWYIHLGFKEDSPAQYPEKLYQQTGFLVYAILTVMTTIALLFINVPGLETLFAPTIPVQ